MTRAAAVLLAVTVVILAAPVAAETAPRNVGRDCAECPALVVVPAGRFAMGSPPSEPDRESWEAGSESPQHVVTVPRAVAIGRTAVTRGEFAAFVAATGHATTGGCHVFDGTDWRLDPQVSWRAADFAQGDDHPVVCVSWHDAMAYVGWLAGRFPDAGYRLPSEAEREYATRAGTTTPYWWGTTVALDQANHDGAGGRGTVAAGSLPANPWGLHEVHGNVWEWTADCYVPSYADRPADLTATAGPRTDRGCDRRSLRGGAWNRHAKTLRAAYRTGLDPRFRGHSIGFRVAADRRTGP